jgi:hypothetical protein
MLASGRAIEFDADFEIGESAKLLDFEQFPGMSLQVLIGIYLRSSTHDCDSV